MSSARLPIAGALATFVVTLGLAALYGFHRDELYIVALGRHPADSIDHAPLVPAVSHLLGAIAGESPFAQRLFAALAGSFLVGVTGALVARLGGDRRAQAIAMFAVFLAPALLYARGVVGTNVVEQLAWMLVAYTLATIIPTADDMKSAPSTLLSDIRTRSARTGYVAIGAIFGVALSNKYSALGLGFALAAGVATSGRDSPLRSRWLFVAPAIALALWSPDLVWQYQHDWPARAFHEAHLAARRAAPWHELFWQQPFQLHPVTFGIAVIGLVAAFRHRTPLHRTLGLATLIYLAIVAVGRGKPYYLAPLYPPLVAFGAVALAPRLEMLRRSPRRVLAGCWIVSAPLVVAMTLPLDPAPQWRQANQEFVQFLDWRALTAELATHYHERFPYGDGAILVGSYGTAAAVELYGPALGLPPPISGANSYYTRKPPVPSPEQATRVAYRALAIGYDEPTLRQFFGTVTPIGELRDPGDPVRDNRFDVPRTIYFCHGMRLPLALGWSRLTRFD